MILAGIEANPANLGGAMRTVLVIAAVFLAAGWTAARAADWPADGELAQLAAPGNPATAVAQQRALFQQLVRDPDNLDLMFAYAQASVAAGDLDQAIATYERMLIFNPDLPRIRAELGLLYYRQNVPTMARQYFQQVLATPDVPEQVRRNVQQMLARIDESTERSRFAGSISFGLRYQTNANGGPASDQIELPLQNQVITVQLDDGLKEEDVNAFLAVSAVHLYDLRDGIGTSWETIGQLYAAEYRNIDELRLGLFEVSTGPRFTLEEGPSETTARLYVVGNYVFLGEDSYYYSYGAGVNLRRVFTPRIVGNLTFQHQERQYPDSDERPVSSQRDGSVDELRADAAFAVGATNRIDASLYLRDVAADEAFRASTEYGGRLGFAHILQSPIRGLRPWTLSAALGGSITEYDEPDPAVSPGVVRQDREWLATATALVPFSESWSGQLSVEYREVDSNVELYSFDNLAVTLSAVMRF